MKKSQTKTTNMTSVVLAIFPTPRGIAYALMESPEKIITSGKRMYTKVCNIKCLSGAENIMKYYMPDLVILENEDSKLCTKSKRVIDLLQKIEQSATHLKLTTIKYTREDIRNAFSPFGVVSRHQIASKIVEWFPEYEERLPQLPKIFECLSTKIDEFDAISLAYTHYYFQ